MRCTLGGGVKKERLEPLSAVSNMVVTNHIQRFCLNLTTIQFHIHTCENTDPLHHHIKFYWTILTRSWRLGQQVKNQCIVGRSRREKNTRYRKKLGGSYNSCRWKWNTELQKEQESKRHCNSIIGKISWWCLWKKSKGSFHMSGSLIIQISLHLFTVSCYCETLRCVEVLFSSKNWVRSFLPGINEINTDASTSQLSHTYTPLYTFTWTHAHIHTLVNFFILNLKQRKWHSLDVLYFQWL